MTHFCCHKQHNLHFPVGGALFRMPSSWTIFRRVSNRDL
jgi:hypothetical protein